MPEFFITANSFAAPFMSDSSDAFVEAETPQAALEQFAAGYGHPAGLFSANAYESADAERKGADPLAAWRCNMQQAIDRAKPVEGAYSLLREGNGFELNGVRHEVEDPRGGSVVA